MSLTMGSVAPLGRPSGGVLNFELPEQPAHFLFLHSLDIRIRGEVGGVTVVDTVAARMLHETALLPRWYFPRDAVVGGSLEASATTSHCPFKGDARYWDLRVGDRLVADAFWEYPHPLAGAPDLSGLVSPYTEKFDRWLVEDEEMLGPPRDPFHRVDARRSSARVTVRAGGEVVAETSRPVAVFETGLPVRWYVPMEDVADGRLAESPTRTTCPYKGVASYWHVDAGGRRFEDGAWAYTEPLLEAVPARGHVSFMGDGIEVEADRGVGPGAGG
jgi:uncharacterized protein (DUF427 family)